MRERRIVRKILFIKTPASNGPLLLERFNERAVAGQNRVARKETAPPKMAY
jgi:hypothetical protein